MDAAPVIKVSISGRDMRKPSNEERQTILLLSSGGKNEKD